MIKKIAVLFGGCSCEHEISILSALQVMHALKEKYHVIPIYISKQGEFYSHEEYMNLSFYQNKGDILKKKDRVYLSREGHHVVCIKNWFKKEYIDFVIPVMHGTSGEDGSIQGFLNILNVPYSGSLLCASSMAQSKSISKQWMMFHDIPVLPFVICREHSKEAPFLPCIIKPDRLGSSIGIEIVEEASKWENALARSFLYDDISLVEPYISDIREFNCSVMRKDDEVVTSSVEEVYKQERILSFHDKYHGKEKIKQRNLTLDIEDEVVEEIKSISKKVYEIFHLNGIIRIDFIYTNKKLYVNEINTIPGSYAYYLWEEDNLLSLLEECIKEGVSMYQKKMTQITSFDSDVLFQYKMGNKCK